MDIPAASSEQIRSQFMTLLLAQLRNQDPLSPVQQHEFISQLTQFSSLEGIERLNEGVEQLAALQDDSVRQQQLMQASQLIGSTIGYSYSQDDSQPARGIVSGVLIGADGVKLAVGDNQVRLEQVTSILADSGVQETMENSAAPLALRAMDAGQAEAGGGMVELLQQLKELL